MSTKTVYLLTILLMLGLATGLPAQNEGGGDQQQPGICFRPIDYQYDVCIDFKKKWYYPYRLSEWMVIYVRDAYSPAASHIWNSGQYLMDFEEWEKLKSALAGQGLPAVCVHPDYRLKPEERPLTRREYCKLQ